MALINQSPDYLIPLPAGRESKQFNRVLIGGGDDTPDEDGFECPVCGKHFVRKWTLARHMKAKHNKRLCEDSDSDDSKRYKICSEDGSNQSSADESEEEEGEEEDGSDAESSEDSEVEEEGSEKADDSEDESSEKEDQEAISEKNIDCLLHLIGAGELGKLEVTTESLQCFIKPEKCPKDEDVNSIVVSSLVLSLLKKLLIAAKRNDVFLTDTLYMDIINAIEIALA
ncbi:Retrotransposon-like protein 1 [Folsomia candida]|uniref:Retrotransposon-like protein 1 n=1 Tax=Folsomia candida TaxID=158441 RepID=A0A226DAT8_FOLCA|nr:Retrotransposon-like protein 1 [Folsomia candida]